MQPTLRVPPRPCRISSALGGIRSGAMALAMLTVGGLLMLNAAQALAAPSVGSVKALNSTAATDSRPDEYPKVAADGLGNWIAVWHSTEDLGPGAGNDADIFFSTSSDAGANWSAAAILNTDANSDSKSDQIPTIATDGAGTWVAVWQAAASGGASIYYAVSTNVGVSWSVPGTLATVGAPTDDNGYPEIASDGADNWIVVWYSSNNIGGAGTDYDIHYSVSTNDGGSWSAPALLNSNATTDSGGDFDSTIASDGMGNWIVAWYSNDTLAGTIDTDNDILYATSSNVGTSWSTVAALNSNAATDSGDDFEPALRSDGSGTWIANWWSDENLGGLIGNDYDILYATSTNAGTSWTAPAALNSNADTDSGDDLDQALATDGQGNWIAIWESDEDLGATIDTDGDILYTTSDDNGATWSAPAALNSNAGVDTGFDFYPALASDGLNDFVAVWFSEDSLGAPIDTDHDILTSTLSLELCGNGVLDDGETCDASVTGNGCCNVTCDGVLAVSTECRAANGDCDTAEVCDGAAASCPVDGFQADTVECRAVAGDCDLAETCTGSSATCPTDLKSTASCRAGAGLCDVEDFCDGASNDCPADAVLDIGTECRAVADVCDTAETCDGATATCPTDVFLDNTNECRASTGECDIEEQCTGSSAECPGDVKLTTVCRAAAGDCDAAEFCDGVANSCPSDTLEPNTTECRAAAGVCDAAETCTGSTVDCPADLKSTALCRAANGACDVDDFCDGSADTCPTDAVADNGTVCRAAADVCDADETCNGIATTCPSDDFQPDTVECRASAGECDLAENCSGSAAECPGDLKSTAECRAAAGECDVAESCDGAADTCPSDGFQAEGLACSSDSNVCTTDECDGAGACANTPNALPCDDGSECTINDACSGGTCGGAALPCDDGQPCTLDTCDDGSGCVFTPGPIAAEQCIEAGKSVFQIVNKDDDVGDKLKWKMVKADFFEQADLGDPVTSTSYALCIYDQTASVATLVGQLEINPNAAWSSIAPKGFKYKDKVSTEDGIRKVLLKAGSDGKSKALLGAGGLNLPTPPPLDGTKFMDQDPSVVVQFLNSEGTCWSSEFLAASSRSNEPSKFIAKSP